jgi:hypothetical protein
MTMSRALLAFNPEAHGSDGDLLLFGVTVPRPMRADGLSALEQLDLASHFLEASSGPGMAAFLGHIIRRSSAVQGQVIPPPIEAPLLQQLMRAAAVVRGALRSSAASGSALSPEAIFGAELEGLSPEDQEFESARRFIQFAEELTRVAARAAPRRSPDLLASPAKNIAARRLAPGLSRALGQSATGFRALPRERRGW